MKIKSDSLLIEGIPFYTSVIQNTYPTKALLLFPEAFATTGHMRDVAHRFARLGFKVYLIQIYCHQGKDSKFFLEPNNKVERESLLQKLSTPQFIDSLSTLKTYFQNYQEIVVAGFSIGGYFSFVASSILPVSKLIAFYPNPTINNQNYNLEPISVFLSSAPPLSLVFFGESDHSIPQSEITLFQEYLPKGDFTIYPSAQHGFFCNSRHTYHKYSAHHAWDLVVNFLK